MTNKTNALIAREWAEGFIKHADSVEIVDAPTLTAARHILNTTTPPTMADVEWDDEVHAGLCAVYTAEDVTVRMIARSPMYTDCIECCWLCAGIMRQGRMPREHLTPIPGTKINLTPRREPEPESTPDHPEVLTTLEDYDSAPEGTIVATWALTPAAKVAGGRWRRLDGEMRSNRDMSQGICHVLRWGWGK